MGNSGRRCTAYTLPPRSFELMVKTTEPIVTSEITSENTCIDCSGGDCSISTVSHAHRTERTYIDR